MNSASHETTLRPAREKDFDFCRRVQRACFKEYVEETWGVWDEENQLQRLQTIFEPQLDTIILLDVQQIGFLRIEDEETYLFIDIHAILPEFQKKGIGTELVQEVIDTALSRNIPVKLSVLKVNPARRLYERLDSVSLAGTNTVILWNGPAPSECAGFGREGW